MLLDWSKQIFTGFYGFFQVDLGIHPGHNGSQFIEAFFVPALFISPKSQNVGPVQRPVSVEIQFVLLEYQIPEFFGLVKTRTVCDFHPPCPFFRAGGGTRLSSYGKPVKAFFQALNTNSPQIPLLGETRRCDKREIMLLKRKANMFSINRWVGNRQPAVHLLIGDIDIQILVLPGMLKRLADYFG